MIFEYVTLCFINIGKICYFQKMQSADIHIILMDSRERLYKYNYINVSILHLISKKNYRVENIFVPVIKRV